MITAFSPHYRSRHFHCKCSRNHCIPTKFKKMRPDMRPADHTHKGSALHGLTAALRNSDQSGGGGNQAQAARQLAVGAPAIRPGGAVGAQERAIRFGERHERSFRTDVAQRRPASETQRVVEEHEPITDRTPKRLHDPAPYPPPPPRPGECPGPARRPS